MKYYGFKDLVKFSALSEDGVKHRLYRQDYRLWGAKKRFGKITVSQKMFEKYWMDTMDDVNSRRRTPLKDRIKAWQESKAEEQSTTD